jgi:ligand-binding SRPBCC domain-containing protein
LIYTLDCELRLPRPIGEVFNFFADAHNLQLLTPPSLHFQVATLEPIIIERGTLIDYRLRVRGIPMRWQSEITVWEPPHRFVDEQRRGPYRSWVHEHTFVADGSDTVVRDRVRYEVFCGWLVNRLFVRKDLEAIFDYRRQTLLRLFAASPA